MSADSRFQAAAASQRAGVERAPQGRAGVLPQISVQQLINRNGVRIPGQSVPGYSTVGFTLSLRQPLFDLQAWENWQEGKLLAADADLELAQAQQDLLLRVAQAYLDALTAKIDVALSIKHRTSIAEQLLLAKRRFALGDATVVDENEAKASFDLALSDEIAAHTRLTAKYAALSKIVGHPVTLVDSIRNDVSIARLEPAALDPWIQASSSSYAVSRKRIALQIAERERSKARSGDYPTVSLVGTLNNGNAAFINGQANFYTGGNRGMAGYVGIQISLPLTDGLMTRSRIREALALRDKAEHELDESLGDAELATRDAYSGVTQGAAQVGALATAVRSACVSLRSSNLGYRVGVRVNADVLDAQDKLFRAQRDLARAQVDVLVQGLKLKASTGTLEYADLAALDKLFQSGQAEPGATEDRSCTA
ncbi:outer membrane protein [Paraburkholderia bannensis]|uniref:Outer membrane protein n=1 Tax=Paraburkholderia bannensis TaxID=765414 RepID=A0A7W9TV56_9BURK|nr:MULTISPECIES: TolC family protein [Paraburkholderia]MBB3257049.1 outer membrane protein [Paraburkholderia sp. WP4_3_2]MBB6102003.1 outer membrane protein [Paraburkholderia bannensis]